MMVRRVKRVMWRILNRGDRFEKLRRKTNGMLDAKIYRRLYEYAFKAPPGDMIEVGAGHGTSTISIALGIKEGSKKNCHLFTFEKCEGGSRSVYGSKDDNLRILTGNLEDYGVSDKVTVISETLSDNGLEHLRVGERAEGISLLFLDADGMISRDFKLFYNLLNPGAYIIVDDYANKKDFRPSCDRYPLGGGKRYRTYCHVNYFMEKGFVEERELIGETMFGIKPTGNNGVQIFNDVELQLIDAHIEEERKKWLEHIGK